MESHVDEEAAAAPAAPTPAAARESDDPEDFRAKWASLLREMIRDEIERYLRSAAD